MSEIVLPNKMITLVDEEDLNLLANHFWYASKDNKIGNYYVKTELKDGRILLMHRIIMHPKTGEFIDHINHDTLDNRKSNLRICTKSQNQRNLKHHKDAKTSKYKGVYKQSGVNLFYAKIFVGKNIVLGKFESEEDAARSYDDAAKKYFGEFAFLNFQN